MARVKICGITNVDDALQAVACGADALGFVFYERSPRNVTPEQAQAIVSQLPPFVTTVGLFVNRAAEPIRQTMTDCGLDVAQLHGADGAGLAELTPIRCLPAISVKDEASLSVMEGQQASAWLLDAYVPGEYGGTGKTFNWALACEAARRYPIILAGGLTAENVADAVRTVQPYGVDVSSGVEAVPGRKDPQKVAAFIRAAKESTKS